MSHQMSSQFQGIITSISKPHLRSLTQLQPVQAVGMHHVVQSALRTATLLLYLSVWSGSTNKMMMIHNP